VRNDHTVEVTDITPTLRTRIEYDQEPENPSEWNNVGKISYVSDRYVLGTEHVSGERNAEIIQGIADGNLVGLSVYAYVHSGSTIRCAPFSDPWDSGLSGFVYCTREAAIKEWGKKILSKKVKEKALAYLEGKVKIFDQYLTGDVYTVSTERVERDEEGQETDCDMLDSCCGFYGLEYAREEAVRLGAYQKVLDVKEAVERLACEERDMVTV